MNNGRSVMLSSETWMLKGSEQQSRVLGEGGRGGGVSGQRLVAVTSFV